VTEPPQCGRTCRCVFLGGCRGLASSRAGDFSAACVRRWCSGRPIAEDHRLHRDGGAWTAGPCLAHPGGVYARSPGVSVSTHGPGPSVLISTPSAPGSGISNTVERETLIGAGFVHFGAVDIGVVLRLNPLIVSGGWGTGAICLPGRCSSPARRGSRTTCRSRAGSCRWRRDDSSGACHTLNARPREPAGRMSGCIGC
jgi:hypothetical protein